MTVVTGLGVILAISASISLADAGVVFASITITPSLPTMMPVFPPAPPCVQYTPPVRGFTESGGGCCWAFARPVNATAARAIAKTRPIFLAVIGSFLSSAQFLVGANGPGGFPDQRAFYAQRVQRTIGCQDLDRSYFLLTAF